MNGYVDNIERTSEENESFRRVLYTVKNCQLVVMTLKPGEEIGEEVHEDGDQFFRIESGEGTVAINGAEHTVHDGDAIIVPAGAKHNILNTSTDAPLKLYTIYAPPHHRDGIEHKTKTDADADDEHFDGLTSEGSDELS